MSEERASLDQVRAFDPSAYRRTLGTFLSGVTIVTALDLEGRNRGITANSFTSVSLDPPLVLFCVGQHSASYQTFVESEGFVVHILGSGQQELARTFASKSSSKFDGLAFSESSAGAAVLDDVHAWLDCRTETVTVAGDHAVVIGKVHDFGVREQRPLGFYRGRFQSFDADSELAMLPNRLGETVLVGWVLEADDGRVVLHARADGSLGIPSMKLAPSEISRDGLAAAAVGWFGPKAKIDFLYSVYGTELHGMTLTYRGRIEGAQTAVEAHRMILFATDEIPWNRITDSSERAVLDRYRNERIEARFGIYMGTRDDGSIAAVGSVNEDVRIRAPEIHAGF